MCICVCVSNVCDGMCACDGVCVGECLMHVMGCEFVCCVCLCVVCVCMFDV